ncbi:hypothetical protein JCM8097_007606 [Rhodosporidiobolus ruineniae]
MQGSHPPTNLLQPSRPTTATQSSDTATFGSPGLLASSSRTPPLTASPSPLPAREPFQVLSTFSKYAEPRGTVRIRVEGSVFYCHKEVLALASPFFGGVLAGGWRETAPRPSAPLRPVSISTDLDRGEEEAPFGLPDDPLHGGSGSTASPPTSAAGDPAPSMSASYVSSVVDDSEDGDEDDWLECRLRICEENASSFQDLLCHIYPRLDCLVSWPNVEDLIRMSAKFDIPSLTNACLAFLLPSAAGRPILGMKIAEENHIPELYKEASRYLLDNYGNWESEELAILSPETLLKLERRRSWFLERLLKLGQVQIIRDYSCHGACDDPSRCARLVSEKWGSAFSATFRFGTPQPSIIYRSLRSLEPSLSSPALHLPFTSCQNHARLWVADLFDRMFNLGITPARNWASLTLNGLPGAATASLPSGSSLGRSGDTAHTQKNNSARYFLYIEMGGGERSEEARRNREGRMGSFA